MIHHQCSNPIDNGEIVELDEYLIVSKVVGWMNMICQEPRCSRQVSHSIANQLMNNSNEYVIDNDSTEMNEKQRIRERETCLYAKLSFSFFSSDKTC